MLTDNKKGVYHSTLTRAGEITVTIQSDVMDSKDKGKYYCVIQHEGFDHFYNIENNACAEALKGRKGQTVTLLATGRDTTAAIEVKGAIEGASPTPPTKVPYASKQKPATDPLANAQKVATEAGKAMDIALLEAVGVRDRFDANNDPKITPEHFQAIAASMFIHMDRVGAIHGLKGVGE